MVEYALQCGAQHERGTAECAAGIGNVLDVLAKELDKLADEEKAAFESRPPGSRDSFSGDESKQAHSILEEAANAVSNHAVELDELTKKPS